MLLFTPGPVNAKLNRSWPRTSDHPRVPAWVNDLETT